MKQLVFHSAFWFTGVGGIGGGRKGKALPTSEANRLVKKIHPDSPAKGSSRLFAEKLDALAADPSQATPEDVSRLGDEMDSLRRQQSQDVFVILELLDWISVGKTPAAKQAKEIYNEFVAKATSTEIDLLLRSIEANGGRRHIVFPLVQLLELVQHRAESPLAREFAALKFDQLKAFNDETDDESFSVALPFALGLQGLLSDFSPALHLLLALPLALAGFMKFKQWRKRWPETAQAEPFRRLYEDPFSATPKDIDELVQASRELRAQKSIQLFAHIGLLYDIEAAGVLLTDDANAFLHDFWKYGTLEEVFLLKRAFIHAERGASNLAQLRSFFILFQRRSHDPDIKDEALNQHLQAMTRFNRRYPLRRDEADSQNTEELWRGLEDLLSTGDSMRILDHCNFLLERACEDPAILFKMHRHFHALVRIAFFHRHLALLSDEPRRRIAQLEELRGLWPLEEGRFLTRDLQSGDPLRQEAAISITELFASIGVEEAKRYHEPEQKDDLSSLEGDGEDN